MIVTKNNLEKVLRRIQKFTNNYKMYEFCKCHTDGSLIWENIYSSIRFTPTYNEDTGKVKKKFIRQTEFVKAIKHPHCDDYDKDEMRPLICLGTGPDEALIIREGDAVIFHLLKPFGFTIFTNNNFTRITDDCPLYIYKNTFIPSFKNPIFDINEEVEKRELEEEDLNELDYEDYSYDDEDEEDEWYYD